MTTPLGGKAGTTDPVTVTTDPNTNVQLLDKDGRVIGSGRLVLMDVLQSRQLVLFQKVMSRQADNAEHPNSSTSDPVKATDTTPPTKPRVTTPLGGKRLL